VINLFIMKKRHIYLLILLFPLILAIVYPLVNRYYLFPKKWKKEFYDAALKKYKNIDEKRISQYTNCVYDNFSANYGMTNIPEKKDYAKEDIRAIAICVLDNLIDGDSLKNFGRNHIGEIVEKLWKDNKKEN
jgi:hypothetical protein